MDLNLTQLNAALIFVKEHAELILAFVVGLALCWMTVRFIVLGIKCVALATLLLFLSSPVLRTQNLSHDLPVDRLQASLPILQNHAHVLWSQLATLRTADSLPTQSTMPSQAQQIR